VQCYRTTPPVTGTCPFDAQPTHRFHVPPHLRPTLIYRNTFFKVKFVSGGWKEFTLFPLAAFQNKILGKCTYLCASLTQLTHEVRRLPSILERGYTRDWLPADSFVVRARAMVLTGERTLSDTSGTRQYCPRARQRAPDNYVYGLSGALKNKLQRADRSTVSDAKLRHSPGMPAVHTRFDP
jgi:hypothetical protein